MIKNKDERVYYLRELMRLQPTTRRKANNVQKITQELFDIGFLEKAERFRATKFAIYGFECDCRARNAELIESAFLNLTERKILRMRYIKSNEWNYVFASIGYSRDRVKHIHCEAIEKISKANPDTDFKALYEQEHKRIADLFEQVGEKI